MIIVGLIALAGLALVALSGRGRSAPSPQDQPGPTADQAIARARASLAAMVEQRERTMRVAPATSGGPPGLLLRREPEIRGLDADALATYVRLTRAWFMEGNVPTEAWWESFVNAQAEILLRGTTSLGSLDDRQVEALQAWLLHLQAKGMPLTGREEGLLVNVREELSWRRANPGQSREGEDPDLPIRQAVDRNSGTQAELDRLSADMARTSAEIDRLEREVREGR